MARDRREAAEASPVDVILLDVNLLIALLDAWHPHHAAARRFFPKAQASGWATCPITENGFLRIVGHANYANGPGTTVGARVLLDALCAVPGHQFWPDAVSLRDADRLPGLPASAHLTDLYLLALAASHGGRLATFDRRIAPGGVAGGKQALLTLGSGR